MCGPFFFKLAGAGAAVALCSPAENGFTQRRRRRRRRRKMTTAKTKLRDTSKKNRKNTSPEFCNDTFAKKPLRNWNA
jgi:hypothetical protein